MYRRELLNRCLLHRYRGCRPICHKAEPEFSPVYHIYFKHLATRCDINRYELKFEISSTKEGAVKTVEEPIILSLFTSLII